jgi:hypothetical protein
MFCEMGDTSPTVSAHGTQVPVGIVIHHGKIGSWMRLQQYQTVCPYAKFSVTHLRYQFGIIFGEIQTAVIDQDKVVTRTLVFIEFDRHTRKGIKNEF